MDTLQKYGALEGTYGGRGKGLKKVVEDVDEYAEDDFVESGEEEDGGKRKAAWETTSCDFSSWTMAQRQGGLSHLIQHTAVARRESELKKLMANGSVPRVPRLWSATLEDTDVNDQEYDDPNDNEALCTELFLRWAPADKGDLVSFFSIECSGQAGKGGNETNYTEIFRDPPDANPDSVFAYSSWYRGSAPRNHRESTRPTGFLIPGASYSFRIRCFNGYGPGEYAYKVFTTRPAPPVQPRPLSIASDSCTLKWIFSESYYQQIDELKKIFNAADADGSGCICRCVKYLICV
jgi:hypothetical protein